MPDTLSPSRVRPAWPHALGRPLLALALLLGPAALSQWPVPGRLMPAELGLITQAHAQTGGPMRSPNGSTNLPRIGDPSGADLSPASERRIGESIMRQMIGQGHVIDDWEIREYLANLSAPLLATDAAAGFSFEFFPVRDISINAFALPGGYIGVHAGLVLAAQSESELASVLAHEIAHVTQRHTSRMVAKSKQASVTAIAGAILAALAASSNPSAAAGMVMLGDSMAQDQMLAFSRDAEREADRVGFDMLSQAGYEPVGMLDFFNRLQQAYKLVDVGVPVYLRSHPLTGERIADVQARLLLLRYRQRADSPEFALVRARLKAMVPTTDNVVTSAPSLLTDEHKRVTRAHFERQVADKLGAQRPDAWYGLAVIRRLSGDTAGARQALAQARRLAVKPQSLIESEAVRIEFDAGQYAQAVKLLDAAMKQFPAQRSFVHLKAETLVKADPAAAVVFLEDQLRLYRGDHGLWNLLSQAHFEQGRDTQGHRARAEAYACLGLWMPAIEQLRIAQRQVRQDFYVGSQIDARLKELERQYQQDQQARI